MKQNPYFSNEQAEVILIDKPLHWTSFDVVNRLRRACRYKKIGHAGTLDPLATGLLILCTGAKTKDISTFQAQEKEYEGAMVLGKTTPSFDLETDFNGQWPISHITNEMMLATAKSLTGEISQIPPVYSAIRVNGQRLYKKARAGEAPTPEARMVMVSAFEINAEDFPRIHFHVVCSKGTYIRSLVQDFGLMLGSGAHLSALCRTRIGEFSVASAWQIDDFIQQKMSALKRESDESA